MTRPMKTLLLTSLAMVSFNMQDAAAKSDNGKGHGHGKDKHSVRYYDHKDVKKNKKEYYRDDDDHHSHSPRHYDDERVLVRFG